VRRQSRQGEGSNARAICLTATNNEKRIPPMSRHSNNPQSRASESATAPSPVRASRQRSSVVAAVADSGARGPRNLVGQIGPSQDLAGSYPARRPDQVPALGDDRQLTLDELAHWSLHAAAQASARLRGACWLCAAELGCRATDACVPRERFGILRQECAEKAGAQR